MLDEKNAVPASGFLRLRQCLKLAPLGRTKFYSLIAEGLAPKPKKVGRASLWSVDEFKEFLCRIDRGELENAPGVNGNRL